MASAVAAAVAATSLPESDGGPALEERPGEMLAKGDAARGLRTRTVGVASS